MINISNPKAMRLSGSRDNLVIPVKPTVRDRIRRIDKYLGCLAKDRIKIAKLTGAPSPRSMCCAIADLEDSMPVALRDLLGKLADKRWTPEKLPEAVVSKAEEMLSGWITSIRN